MFNRENRGKVLYFVFFMVPQSKWLQDPTFGSPDAPVLHVEPPDLCPKLRDFASARAWCRIWISVKSCCVVTLKKKAESLTAMFW